MSKYIEAYKNQTGNDAPTGALQLDVLFDQIEQHKTLPPRGQQAVDLGFTAHTLNDPKENPEIFRYYYWIINHFFVNEPIDELSANMIGNSFVSANVIESNLPQPITLNPWQIKQLKDPRFSTKRAVIIENNGVFIWLHHLHPTWPLINQSGNDFNKYYNSILNKIVDEKIQLTYLGDLDSKGIQIADHLSNIVGPNIFDIQTPEQVLDWLVRFGKVDPQRCKLLQVNNPSLQLEAESINTIGKFVEQEQLIEEYEQLIGQWLG